MTQHPPKTKPPILEEERLLLQQMIDYLRNYPDSKEDDIKYEIKLVNAIKFPKIVSILKDGKDND